MPSGGKTLVVNGLERAVSTDINRLQAFQGKTLAEVLRYLVDVNLGLDDVAAGDAAQAAGVGDVLGGLIVRPIGGTLTCSVDPGAMLVNYADAPADPDSSLLKVAIDSVGVPSSSPLVIPANTSGSRRIDVITASYSVNVNAETDNRDIFVPSTGAVAATTVPKATAGQLSYALISGTAGGGFASVTIPLGAIPLCVISVPSGAVTVTDCTWWDVRPAVSDRWNAPHNQGSVTSRTRANQLAVDVVTTPGKALLGGYVEATATDLGVLSGGPASLYRLGGLFQETVDFNVAGNQSGSPSGGPVYVYLLEPFGLPRWAQYVTSSGALVPGPRGIPTVSSTAPVGLLLCPSSALAMPLATGLGGTCTKAVCVGCTSLVGGLVLGMLTGGGLQIGASASGVFPPIGGTIVAGNQLNFSLSAGTYPAHAKSLRVAISVDISIPGTSFGTFVFPRLLVQNAAFSAFYAQILLGSEKWSNGGSGSIDWQLSKEFDIPVPAPVAGGAFGVTYLTELATATLSSGSLTILGWGV
jgi:hypothetical protein